MESFMKILIESGIPVWAQALLIPLCFLGYHIINRRYSNNALLKGKSEFHKKMIESNSLTRIHYESVFHIKTQVSTNQRRLSSAILQVFINSISVQYEKGLSALNVGTEESELLILAFNGFLYRLKEELMEQISTVIESKGFKSDNYIATKNSLARTSTSISLCVTKTFRESYKKNRFKVEFSNNIPEVNIEDMLEELYSQVKKVGREGEEEIENITQEYEISMKNIIGEL